MSDPDEPSLAVRVAELERRVAEQATPPDGAVVSRVVRLLPWLMASHLLVGAPALIISLIVAYGTFVQAEATQKMQLAGAWPYVTYATSNYTDEGQRRLDLILTNDGVGPARLGPIELTYRGRPVATPQDLLTRCCGYRPGAPIQFASSPAQRVVLRAGDSTRFFSLPDVPANRAIIDRFETERWRVQVRACYCSIFQNCWTIEGPQSEPVPVKQCPAGWAPFRER